MGREPDGEGGRELDPAPDEFDAIVSGWRREGPVPEWPDDADSAALFQPPPPTPGHADTDGDLAFDAPFPVDAPLPVGAPLPIDVPVHASADAAADEGHFVPPDPPPLPPIGPPALVGLVLLGLGLVLVSAPGWLGMSSAYGLPLGLVALAAGLGWLVLRLWPDPLHRGDGDGRDDGAVL